MRRKQELIARKLELAELSERETVHRQEVFRLREANRVLSIKMTNLEVALAQRAGPPGKPPPKR